MPSSSTGTAGAHATRQTTKPSIDTNPSLTLNGGEAQQPTTAVNEASTAQHKSVLFGLEQHSPIGFSPPLVFKDDYEKRLPPDEYGKEMDPNARVWRAYEEEAATFDTALVGQARDGLDVMLVFAGLFSAVVTSFLIQVSNSLHADFSQMSALLLHDIVVMQIQAGDASAARNITVPSVDPTADFEPSALVVWINGLWVVSLAASLVVALSAVLVKQWLHHYMTLPSGTPGLRSHVRQFRFMGLEKWRVSHIIGALPIIMHISLTLFFCGLILFYIPMSASLAYTIGVVSTIVLVIYVASNTMPIIFPECPYQTPFTQMIQYFFRGANRILCWATAVTARIAKSRVAVFLSIPGLRNIRWPHMHMSKPLTLSMREAGAVQRNYDELSIDAVDWLFHLSSNPSLRSVVIQAIGALPWSVRGRARSLWKRNQEMHSTRKQLIRASCLLKCRYEIVQCRRGREDDLERLLRSCSFLELSMDEYHFGAKDEVFIHNLRAKASAWGANVISSQSQSHPDDVPAIMPFLWAADDVAIHVNVWRSIIERAFDAISTETAQHHYAYWIDVLLLSPSNHPPSTPYELENVPVLRLRDAVRVYPLRNQILAAILRLDRLIAHDHLKDLDSSSLESLEFRVAYAIGSHIVQDLQYGSPLYWKLLSFVLDQISKRYRTGNPGQTEIQTINGLLGNIIDHTPLCDLDGDADTTEEQYQCFMFLLSAYSGFPRDRSGSGWLIASCRRLIDCGMRLAQNGYVVPAALEKHMQAVDWALCRAARDGRMEAFELFGVYDWPKIICDIHSNSQPERLPLCIGRESSTIIRYCMEYGFNNLDETNDEMAPHRDFFMQSRNLTLICISIAQEAFSPLANIFADFNQSHPSWGEVISRLEALCAWCGARNEMASLDFPLNGLFGKTMFKENASLDDIIRDQFIADGRLRERTIDFLWVLKKRRAVSAASFGTR